MIYIFLGPPGSGKDTQAQLLADYLGGQVVSVGEAVREAIEQKHPRASELSQLINSGQLVPDDLLEEILENYWQKVSGRIVVITGFPRRVAQMELLERVAMRHGQKVRQIFYLRTDEAVVIERLSGRWYAPGSDRTYHDKYNPPKVPGHDDLTGEPLMRRDDDTPAAISRRLEVFQREIAPVLDTLKQRYGDRLVELDGNLDIEEIQTNVNQSL